MPFAPVGGIELFYEDDDFRPPWGISETAPVIMQHYVYGSTREWTPWVPLVARDHRVLRFDRRGNGNSGNPPYGYQHNVDDLVEEIVGFLDYMEIDRVNYIGRAVGGVLGAVLAARHPDRVKTLTLLTAPTHISEEMIDALVRGDYPDGAQAVEAYGTKTFTLLRNLDRKWRVPEEGETPDHYRRRMENLLRAVFMAEESAKIPTHLMASLIRMISAPEFNITSLLPDIAAPTLLMSPTDVPGMSLDDQAVIASTIPNCQQVIIRGVDFFVAPENLTTIYLDFLRQHEGHQSA